MSRSSETLTIQLAEREEIWDSHQSNRTDGEYEVLRQEFWDVAKPQLAVSSSEELPAYSFLAERLTRELDNWDENRAAYTHGKTVRDYIIFLEGELGEHREDPEDSKEIADVIIFANRVWCHPDATKVHKQFAIEFQVSFVEKLIKNHAHEGSPEEIVWEAIRRNEEHYPPAIYDSLAFEAGGRFMKGIRRNFSGNQLPLPNQWYAGYERKVIGMNGRGFLNEEALRELEEHFDYLYPKPEKQASTASVVAIGGTRDNGSRGVIYERALEPAAD